MFVIIILTYISLFLAVRKINYNKFAKRAIFVIISFWMLCLAVSTFNPYGLFPVSPYVYLLLLLNVFSFSFGFLSRKNPYLYNKDVYRARVDLGVDKIFSSKVYYIVLIIAIIATWYLTYQQRAYVLMYNLGALRQNFYGVMFEGKPAMAFVYLYFLGPAYEFALFLFCYLIIYNRRWGQIGLLIAFIAPFLFLSGGRTRAMMIVFYFVFAVISNEVFNNTNETKTQLHYNFKYFIRISIALVALFLLFSYTSALRLGADELNKETASAAVDKSLTQICTYSTGSFRAFEYALDNDYLSKIGGYKFGQATFGGIESFLERIIRHATGFKIYNVTDDTVMLLQENEIIVGKGSQETFNYAYTNAIYHYFDFGYIGIIIFPFLFGRFFKKYLDFAYYRPSVFSMALVAYLFEIGVYSVFSLLTATDLQAIPYICILIYFAKKTRVQNLLK